MTRETKVGLLVGMGIILLIGILVSDHLSVARHQAAADLTHFAQQAQQSVNTSSRWGNPTPTPNTASRPPASDLQRQSAPRPAPVSTTRTHPVLTPAEISAPQPNRPWPTQTPAHPPHPQPVTPPTNRVAQAHRPAAMPSLSQTQINRPNETTQIPATPTPTLISRSTLIPSPPTPPRKTTATHVPKPVIHYVGEGESLWQIAQRYYGNGDYWQTIAQANPKAVMPDGNVRLGVRLVIPNQAGLANTTPTRNPSPPPAASGRRGLPTPDRIEVKPGDSLSALAARHLGSSDQWRQLYEANRDQLKQPDQIRVGMKLRLPKASSRQAVRTTTEQPRARRDPKSTYTVRANDSLSSIAHRVLGDPNRWEEIYQANTHQLDDPNDLRVGQRLKIPRR